MQRRMHIRGIREGMKVKELVFILNEALSDINLRLHGLRAHLLRNLIRSHVHILEAQQVCMYKIK